MKYLPLLLLLAGCTSRTVYYNTSHNMLHYYTELGYVYGRNFERGDKTFSAEKLRQAVDEGDRCPSHLYLGH